MGFVVDELILEQVFVRVLRFPSGQYHSIIPPTLCTHLRIQLLITQEHASEACGASKKKKERKK